MVTNPKRSRIQVLKFSRKEKQEKRKNEAEYLQEVQPLRQLAERERKPVSMKYRIQTADWIQNAD